jgi:hypothetical protein
MILILAVLALGNLALGHWLTGVSLAFVIVGLAGLARR